MFRGRHLALDCAIAIKVFRPVAGNDSANALERFKQEGIRVTLLSGDRRQTAERIAERLGRMEVIAEVLPADKDRVGRPWCRHPSCRKAR